MVLLGGMNYLIRGSWLDRAYQQTIIQSLRNQQEKDRFQHTGDAMSITNRRILVTDGDRRTSFVVARSLSKAGAKIDVVQPLKTTMGFGSSSRYFGIRLAEGVLSRLPDGVILDYLAQHRTLVEHQLRNIRRNYDFVIPVSLQSIRDVLILDLRNHTLLPSLEVFDVARDKARLIQKAESLGVNVPRTTLVESLSQLRNELSCGDYEYPVVLKVRHESTLNPSQRIAFARSWDQAIDGYEHLAPHSQGLLLQEYVVGISVGYFALNDRSGKEHSFFCHRRIREEFLRGGPSTVCESYFDAQLVRAGRKLLEGIGLKGVGMAEFKMHPKKGPILMEVNPRFWGSLPLATASGVDFPRLLVELGLGMNPRRVRSYRLGVVCQFVLMDILRGVRFFRAGLGPSELFAPFATALNPSTYQGLFSWRDPATYFHS